MINKGGKMRQNKTLQENMEDFFQEIENRVYQHDIGWLEAILEYCEDTGLEPDRESKLVSPNLKSKLELEAKSLNFIKNSSKLPV